MKLVAVIPDNGDTRVNSQANERGLNPKLIKFLDCFSRINDNPKLFPKECRSCTEEFASLAEYLSLTSPKGHGLEDCSTVMKRPYTMCYRHCTCGNTLVLSLTVEEFPEINEFWEVLREVADESGVPLFDVVARFVAHCQRHILAETPCLRSPTRTVNYDGEDS